MLGIRLYLNPYSVGKTSLIKQYPFFVSNRSRYVTSSFSTQYKATIGTDFLTKDLIIENKHVSMQIWDTAGQEKFHSLQGVFYKGADGCLIVYDITDPDSFQGIEKWRAEFIEGAGINAVPNFPFLLLGNKSDLVADRRVAFPKAIQTAKDMGVTYYETSAKNAMNIKQAFEDIARKACGVKKDKLQDI